MQEEKKLGLQPSDTEDYNVNDGQMGAGRRGEYKEGRHGRKEPVRSRPKTWIITGFASGVIFCAVLLMLAPHVPGVGGLVIGPQYKYYKELDATYGKYDQIMKMIGEDPLAEKAPESISDEQLKKIVADTGDPYAEYFTADEYEEFHRRYEEDYVGIGIIVSEKDGNVVVMYVIDDGPAAEAGVKKGDIIAKVDGKKPENVDAAVRMISGEAGTGVDISIDRKGEIIDLEMNRSRIEQDSVAASAYKGHPEIGYIRIASFKKGTDDEFRMAVKDLKSEGCKKFIIDLRYNGGGLTDASISIADYLLPECRIMSEVTKSGKEKVYKSKPSSADLDCAVLVNGSTASASEILTAALQDNEAAVVIGSKTYGKGVTQTLHKFKDGSGVKLTVTEYFRPSGKKVNGVGITPDIETKEDEELETAVRELEH